MKAKQNARMVVDMVMVIMLPLLMAYSLVGEEAHECLGIAMFLLFIGHHLLNLAWWKNLLKGKYTADRILGTTVNILLLVIMIALPISGMMMSRYAFPIFVWSTDAFLARTIHMLAAYWGFVFMSIHVGLHTKKFLHMAKKPFHIFKTSKCRTQALRIIAVGISGYGVYAFIHRKFADYMFLRMQFVFFNLTEPLIYFMVDYLAIMLLFAFSAHYLKMNILQKSDTLHE